ncbi:MAG: hypothetical protein DRH12_10385 [Deltaproteobacteria bacterium]|nr:MAG: hypothetical protein DRH12_10385 [Deltaproteobacteria bacterium]
MGTIFDNDIEKLIPKSSRDNEGLELITCKRQPGNLRITKYACALRYRKSLRMDDEIPDDEFGMIIKHGLERCRDCPRGRRYAEILLQEDSAQRQTGKRRRGRPSKVPALGGEGTQAKPVSPRKRQPKKRTVAPAGEF